MTSIHPPNLQGCDIRFDDHRYKPTLRVVTQNDLATDVVSRVSNTNGVDGRDGFNTPAFLVFADDFQDGFVMVKAEPGKHELSRPVAKKIRNTQSHAVAADGFDLPPSVIATRYG